jgi:hypothetical protein
MPLSFSATHMAGCHKTSASFWGSSFVGPCMDVHAGVPMQGGKQEPQLDKANLQQTDVEENGQLRLEGLALFDV